MKEALQKEINRLRQKSLHTASYWEYTGTTIFIYDNH